jgi:V8-like Glu-specific endopeptidase
MAAKPDLPKPLSKRAMSRGMRARAAPRGAGGRITRSVFVAGDKPPQVEARVISIERGTNGGSLQHYEVRVEVNGVRLGERSVAPPLRARPIKERIPRERVRDYEHLLTAFVPDHLAVDPRPQRLLKPHRRIPLRLEKRKRYNTTIFDPEQRQVFRDTSYPWSAFGRCETNFGPFSGVMIGPRHVLTCNHGIDWTPPPGFDADWLTFTPSYFDGDAPFGSTYATLVYFVQKDNNDGLSNGNEGQYDYVVLVLNDRIGDLTGWLGTRRYTDAWDPLAVWWHIGYPGDLTSFERPVFQSWFTMNGHDNQDDAHEIIYHQADVFPGQSGGPMFGFWDGDVGPRAVAVQSWQNTDTNGASGGGDLVDLAIRARDENP